MKKSIVIIISFLFCSFSHVYSQSATDFNLFRAYNELSGTDFYGITHLVLGETCSDNAEVGGENSSDIPGLQNLMQYS